MLSAPENAVSHGVCYLWRTRDGRPIRQGAFQESGGSHLGCSHMDTLSRCGDWPVRAVLRYESESDMVVDSSGKSLELPIFISTVWLLAVVVGEVIITARLTRSFLLGRKPILLGFVVGLSWLATLSSWAFITSVLVPTDSPQLTFVLCGFIALAASVIFGIATSIASASQPRE